MAKRNARNRFQNNTNAPFILCSPIVDLSTIPQIPFLESVLSPAYFEPKVRSITKQSFEIKAVVLRLAN